MNIKKLLEELEEFKPWSNVDELSTTIINDGDFFRKYTEKAVNDFRKGKNVNWLKLAKLGKEKYNKKFNTPQFTDEDLQKVAKELEDYYTTD